MGGVGRAEQQPCPDRFAIYPQAQGSQDGSDVSNELQEKFDDMAAQNLMQNGPKRRI